MKLEEKAVANELPARSFTPVDKFIVMVAEFGAAGYREKDAVWLDEL